MCSGWTSGNRWSRSRFEQLEKKTKKPAGDASPAGFSRFLQPAGKSGLPAWRLQTAAAENLHERVDVLEIDRQIAVAVRVIESARRSAGQNRYERIDVLEIDHAVAVHVAAENGGVLGRGECEGPSEAGAEAAAARALPAVAT